jgi:shikimate kinase
MPRRIVILRYGSGTMVAMTSVYLVGFMGSGKSATAEALATLLGVPAVDLDAEIERELGRTIAEVFAHEGEAAFRAAERRLLAALVARGESRVVALGGGAFAAEENRDLLAEAGEISVFLDLPFAVLRDRLAAADRSRPLYDPATAAVLFATRRPAYLQASAVIRLDGSEAPAEVARRIHEEVMCAT